MNDPTILLPKYGNKLWPVTEYVFRKLGINYDPCSRKYRIDAGDVEFFLGSPKDWRTAIEYRLVKAAVTGLDLVVDDMCKTEYVIPKRAKQIADMLQKGIKEEPVEFIRRKLGFYETEIQSVYSRIFYDKPSYIFEDARNLRGFPYPLLKLRQGEGKVVLLGSFPQRLCWNPTNIGCSANYRNLSELWLDENYLGSDVPDYRLVPFNGSLEGTDFCAVIGFMQTGETAKSNGRNVSEEILNSQAVVVSKGDEAKLLLEKLFENIMVK